MKKSLEDYKEMVVKPQFDWIKIHWKGWMLIMIISACIPYIVYYGNDIVNSIKTKFSKEEEENERCINRNCWRYIYLPVIKQR